jgi:predicted metal-binding membrane protein
MTNTESSAATAAALAATLGLAAIGWAVVVHQMSGMDMGSMTPLGPFAPFIITWIVMMVAMMLPGLTPTLWRRAQAGSRVHDVLLFTVSYLAVWGLFGVPVYLLYQPHDTVIAGVVTIAAGLYELTPVRRSFRRRCCEDGYSGLAFGVCCVGSSIGLMLMQVSLGIMSIAWMVVASVLIVGQKLLPPRPLVDVPLALAVIALGVLIIVAPSSVPGLTPPMSMSMPM